jgi:hypothetical protein
MGYELRAASASSALHRHLLAAPSLPSQAGPFSVVETRCTTAELVIQFVIKLFTTSYLLDRAIHYVTDNGDLIVLA